MRSATHLLNLFARYQECRHRRANHIIEYLMEENHVLRAQVRGRRLRLTRDQRRRLAARGRRPGHEARVTVYALLVAFDQTAPTSSLVLQGRRRHAP